LEQWRTLQQLLIKVMKADPANKNPSRVFRLAGGWHVKPGREPKRTQIVQESGQKYSYQELKDKLIALAKPPLTTPLLESANHYQNADFLQHKRVTKILVYPYRRLYPSKFV
jgi:hypothetical protein